MSGFYKRFLAETPSSPGELTLFALGKHPGWDDHVDQIGINNETLALFHSVFYVNGIRAVIDSGVWERTDPVKVIPEFGNLAIWQARKSFLMFRMWPSRDGKGRSKYPMIVGVYGGGVPLLQAFPKLASVLAGLEEACRATTTADELRTTLNQYQQEIRQSIGTLRGGSIVDPLEAEDFQNWSQRLEADDDTGWLRVLYALSNQMAAFGSGEFTLRQAGSRDGIHLRVPLHDQPHPDGADLLPWLRLFRSEIDPQVPLFLSCSLGRPWCDVVAGEPGNGDFSFLRLNKEGLPPVDSVPYNISDPFRERALQLLQSWRAAGHGPGRTVFPGSGERNAPDSAGGWLKRLFSR